MPHEHIASIDNVTRFGRVLHIRGWSSLHHPGVDFRIAVHAKIVAMDVQPAQRADVASVHGSAAEAWGFEAVFVFASDADAVRSATATLRLSSSLGVLDISPRPAEPPTQEAVTLQERFFSAVHEREDARVLEIGSRARSGVVRKSLFGNADYFGIDIVDGENVDAVIDAHQMSRHNIGMFDFVYSGAVFEHILMPWKVAVEMSRVMKPGGLALVHTIQSWPEHDAPWDYWRFSRNSWHAVFNRQTGFEIVQTAYSEPCLFVPAHETGNPVTDFGGQTGFLGVYCLARKTGEASVDWPLTPRRSSG